MAAWNRFYPVLLYLIKNKIEAAISQGEIAAISQGEIALYLSLSLYLSRFKSSSAQGLSVELVKRSSCDINGCHAGILCKLAHL